MTTYYEIVGRAIAPPRRNSGFHRARDSDWALSLGLVASGEPSAFSIASAHLISLPVGRSVGHSVGFSFGYAIGHSLGYTVGLSVGYSVRRSILLSLCRPIYDRWENSLEKSHAMVLISSNTIRRSDFDMLIMFSRCGRKESQENVSDARKGSEKKVKKR